MATATNGASGVARAARGVVDVPEPRSMESLHRRAGTGRTYWGPGDLYTFLVTGAESGGAYFAMEAVVPPGGGPPLHIHRNENETFYVLEGHCTFHLGEKVVVAGPGDFVNIPIGTLHFFRNDSAEPVRLVLTF